MFTEEVEVANEGWTILFLNKFHENLISEPKNLKVHHSDQFSIKTFSGFDEIYKELRKVEHIDFSHTSHTGFVVYCRTNPECLRELFKKVIDVINVYGTIYFTESIETINNVKKNGLLLIINESGLEREYQVIVEAKRRKQKKLFNFLNIS